MKKQKEIYAKMKSTKQMSKKERLEANARRKVNNDWQRVEKQHNYRCAATWLTCKKTTSTIKDECFDGIFLQLNERSEAKSYSSKKRLLRRIVEKRQAQSIHRSIGRSVDRFSNRMKVRSICDCVEQLHRHQFCA